MTNLEGFVKCLQLPIPQEVWMPKDFVISFVSQGESALKPAIQTIP